ncbi:hypothetical protein A2627_03445 [Candidatus Woesebacteria bacterium RIFCSPHIGHO2_01_FULL_39_28]|uniref:Plasmid stabilization protein n=1 Tax=Candidatus Woesebacteria bacterium RIFCSPHIGHO2_01_FULL_39_28 TaxID=1802496 RepID=A0A1F7YB63_9BACT|nr:MAG: hypothetical protein A2627_03445 [Candidatus Woesebacteria bacterium RIFCSPHIGHO2_01_FULL_39_28]OGM57493.1 MAG: hypothetical protein A3A50_00255 [Candidatus Woesebacteria bacterium RIFCSPLOWO2_01_FULL_38_20]
MYKVVFRERVIKSLKRRIHPKDREKILSKVEDLAQDLFSRSLDIKKLLAFENLEKTYRLRVGEFRVFYELDTKTKSIIIYKIDYRKTTTY